MELGVNTRLFRPGLASNEIRKKHHIPEDSILLLYVGRLAPEKNVKTLFNAFQLLHLAEPGKYHLLIVGDGTTRESLQRLEASTHTVTWLPYCENSEKLVEIYHAADLFVHPGVLETFGLVTLESQACGTPVVGIRGSYMDRIIYTDLANWAAENTPQSLAEAIAQTARLDLKKIGSLASQKVRERYDWDEVFTKLLQVYESCQS